MKTVGSPFNCYNIKKEKDDIILFRDDICMILKLILKK